MDIGIRQETDSAISIFLVQCCLLRTWREEHQEMIVQVLETISGKKLDNYNYQNPEYLFLNSWDDMVWNVTGEVAIGNTDTENLCSKYNS